MSETTKTERVINRLRSLPRSAVITEGINELQRLSNALEAAYRTIDAARAAYETIDVVRKREQQ